MGAHHREVVLVDVDGARESVGVLCPASEQLVQKTTRVLPPVKGLELGAIVDLDPDSTVKVDDRVTFVVSCQECAGLSLGHCIDKGHVQLVGASCCVVGCGLMLVVSLTLLYKTSRQPVASGRPMSTLYLVHNTVWASSGQSWPPVS